MRHDRTSAWTLGELRVTELDYRIVSEWQTAIGRKLAPRTVRHHRQTLAQIIDEAVKMGALPGNPVRTVKPVRVPDAAGVALEAGEAKVLLAATADHRLGAAVALLFLQGWRVSEVLGLAWEDLDLDAGTARLRRASVYIDGRGQQLGPPKTDGVRGEHWLMPTVVALLAKRRDDQSAERAAVPDWATHTYDGNEINLVFTTPTGGLVLRQSVAKVVKQAAKTAGIKADLGTHAGRRTVESNAESNGPGSWLTSLKPAGRKVLMRATVLDGRGLRRPTAEGVGFEPTVGRTHTRFPSVPIRPLSHPSSGGPRGGTRYRVRRP